MSKKFKGRNTDRDYAVLSEAPAHIKKLYKHINIDKELKIVLYGEPFSDTRPKVRKVGIGVGNINLSRMKVVFRDVYNRSEILQKLIIKSPYVMNATFYMTPTKKEEGYLLKQASKSEKSLFLEERLYDIKEKDVDNMIKIHNDILMLKEYHIIVSDGCNVGIINPTKVLSQDPRAEVFLYYSSKPLPFYKNKIEESMDYYKSVISYKEMLMHERTPDKQLKFLRKTFINKLEDRRPAQYRDLLKSTAKLLHERYPAVVLKQMADLEDSKFNKFNAIFKIMMIITKGNKECTRIIENGGVLSYDSGNSDEEEF